MNEEYLELISLNIWHIAATVGNLLILTWIIKKFLWERVQKVLAERRGQVDTLYREAEESRSQAEADRILYREKLDHAGEEADEIIRTATERADRLSDEIVADAEKKAADTIRKADADIALEKKKAMNELKDEISDISVQIARSVVQREIKEDDHKNLIDSFIDNL
ncbi:MAG: F0F1 ATP synthase subunit B [Clostridia bacterium]|nr:F0F1 ATP synthase subunit B [Clostridia bacterium]MBQ8333180.1 F0F1 ATP synthase subunit B [Clostridia bacterium]MBQ8369574.1 F0F1 ATP synthase subunit B [Clostridia bacterium]MBQ8512164.1 F0F1 ATP synthase subunit B [Clostridia bacterium]